VAQAQDAYPVEFVLSMQGHYNSSWQVPFSFVVKGNLQTITTLIKPKTATIPTTVTMSVFQVITNS
jgi:hypothetical protein